MMPDVREVKLSKLIAKALRHKPEKIGITLDEHGWADIDELIQGIQACGREIDYPTLDRIVKETANRDSLSARTGRKYGQIMDIR